MIMQDEVIATPTAPKRIPWNKGKLTGAKPPLRPKHVWSIRTKLQIEGRTRDLAMFNLRSTASFAAVTSSLSGSRMSPPAATRQIVQRFDKRKLGSLPDLN
jgi:hypothetical protein